MTIVKGRQTKKERPDVRQGVPGLTEDSTLKQGAST